MRYVRILLSLIIMLTVLVACASDRDIEVSCGDFDKSQHLSNDIIVAVGDEFSITLCSNPSTGFRWLEQAEILDQEVVEQINHALIMPPEKKMPPPPGTPGTEVWTFKALKKGSSTISQKEYPY